MADIGMSVQAGRSHKVKYLASCQTFLMMKSYHYKSPMLMEGCGLYQWDYLLLNEIEKLLEKEPWLRIKLLFPGGPGSLLYSLHKHIHPYDTISYLLTINGPAT